MWDSFLGMFFPIFAFPLLLEIIAPPRAARQFRKKQSLLLFGLDFAKSCEIRGLTGEDPVLPYVYSRASVDIHSET